MELNTFMSDDVADALYTGRFGKYHIMATGERFRPVEELPEELKKWVDNEHPDTTHIRIGPVMGSENRNRMDWWVGGWMNSEEEQPSWTSMIFTQWRKT